MSQKRRDRDNELSTREKKKLKVSVVHSIAVQSTVLQEALSSTAATNLDTTGANSG